MTAVPSKEDGNDAIMRPHLFRTAVQYRLGIPLLKEAIPFLCARSPSNPMATTPLAVQTQGIASLDTMLFATW